MVETLAVVMLTVWAGSDVTAAPNPSYNTVISTVPTGAGPFGLAVTPDGREVWVAELGGGGSGNIRVVSVPTNTATAGIVTPGMGPIGVAISPDCGRVYVTNSRSHDVTVIDRRRHAILATIPVGDTPLFIAIHPAGTKAYVANSGNTSGTTVSVISIPAQIDEADPLGGHTVKDITVGTQPRGVALLPDGSRLYVTNGQDDSVSVIDTVSENVIKTITGLGTHPAGIAVTPDGSRAYVVNAASHTISVIDTATNEVIPAETFSLQGNYGIAITPDGTRAYVPMAGLDAVASVDLTTHAVTSISTGSGSAPSNIAIHPSGKRAYSGNESNDTVSVIDTQPSLGHSPTAAAGGHGLVNASRCRAF